MKKLKDSILTIGKVIFKSGYKLKGANRREGDTLIVMGNGPSLRDTIDSSLELLRNSDTMAVNFAANTPEFFHIRPMHYVLADPLFFENLHPDCPSHESLPNMVELWGNIGKIDWPMTLHLPYRELKKIKKSRIKLPENITLKPFNVTPGEGYDFICHFLYRQGLAMPRPRNVLIPAIMEGIREGYRNIYLVGADHTWPHTLYVDDCNRVVTVQPHFYKENPKELDRIAEVYSKVRLHDVLQSMVIAFRSYHAINGYARKRGVKIFNATPGSLIDAFPRASLLQENS